MKKHGWILFLVIVLSMIIGCKESLTGPEDDSKNLRLGDGSLTGDVFVYHYPTELFTPDNSGVTVSIEGTQLSTVTDMSGSWTIKGLGDDVYTIVYSKSGYNTYKKSLQYKVGVNDYDGGSVVVYRTPVCYYEIDKVFPQFSGVASPYMPETWHTSIIVQGRKKSNSMSATSTWLHLRVFVSTTPDVSSDPSKYVFSFAGPVVRDDNVTIDSVTFHQNGFSSGQLVYIIGYSEWYNAGSYTDLATGKNVYPALNSTPSNVVAIKIP